MPESEVDVAIVGAGAAGIAAARTCLAAGLRVAVLEARDRVGGRAVTASFAGHPVDLGAHWMHAGALNPLVRIGQARGEPLRRAPGQSHLVMRGRFAARAERRSYSAAFERADTAIAAAARRPEDGSIGEVRPSLGRWGKPIGDTLALVSGRPLEEVSLKDFPSDEFGDNYFVRGGYGAFLARLAAGLPIALGRPVETIDWSGRDVVLRTGAGDVRARAVVVTAPLPVIAAGRVRFAPALPAAVADAIAAFLPGAYEHVVLNWPDTPFRGADRLTKLVGGRVGLGMMTRMDDAPFHYLELDHAIVEGRGRRAAALAGLAREALREAFGPSARRARVLAVTDWLSDPWSLCSWVVVAPGRVADRETISAGVDGRIWFAGEANSRALWGTAGGAWEEGERAAREAVARLAHVVGTRRNRVPSTV